MRTSPLQNYLQITCHIISALQTFHLTRTNDLAHLIVVIIIIVIIIITIP
jgi:hypothetical protein